MYWIVQTLVLKLTSGVVDLRSSDVVPLRNVRYYSTLLNQDLPSKQQNLTQPLCWRVKFSSSGATTSLDRRSTTPHVSIKLMILVAKNSYFYNYCRSGASEASEGTTLNTETVKRFSDFAHRYVLMEFSVAPNFSARCQFCVFWIEIGVILYKIENKCQLMK